ncbi:MAG TPA: hypothetical protein EYN68_10675 [Candidatus Marinimicrobia bacterium]|nr:hypothetical protein [Candidatus Neomarinimicrobiota bacterium]HIB03417.1 hypothetical protein [Candidatus Neomarinimicrobiota bacterium]HIB71799.1 hypothetical protein [Candidatus Neomarinimicrobiota bacterium]HIB95860.1 hypothetical protein [Candidatus Neomarinimicrobiota bacterium]
MYFSKRTVSLTLSLSFLVAGPKSYDVVSDDLKNRIFEITRATGSIIVDADLDDVGWADAASTDFFLEIQPGDNVDPPDPTEVKVTYDKDNLYVAFMAYSDPDDIRASLQKRDQAWRDDFVAIIIDAYGDANAAVMIGSNPLGVQMDALNQGQHDDDSYDIIYESAGKITDKGFHVEMAIPFSSLSFPKKKIQEWKVTFFRSFPRDARHMVTWGGLDRSNQCWLCQLGTLKGIQGIEQKGKLEFLPTLIGSQSSELDENNALKKGSSEGEVSMGIKYSLSSDRVAEIAINPDFSQVEADEEQIDVNTTFALNYPEKRPFFNEGADLTDTPVSVVYTRSINNPTGVGRIINRGQKDSWLLLSALDEDSPYIVPGEEQSFTRMGSKSFSNIFRYKRSLNEGSFLGLIATDRRMVDNQGSGSVVGFDTRYRFNDTYQVEFQSVFSHTQEPDDSLLISSATFGDNHTFTFDGESFSGNALKLEFDRNTEHWRMEVGYDHRTPTFRAENGFVTNANNRRIFGQSLWIYFPNNFFSQVLGGVHAGVEHNFDGVQKAKYIALFSNLAMPRQTRLNVMYARRMQYRFKDTELKGTYDIKINLNSQFSERYQFGTNIGRHVAPVRFLEVPEEGRLAVLEFWTRMQASDRLNVGLSYNSQKMTTMDRKTDYFSGYTATLRASYQHNKSLGFKVLTQYNDFSKDFQIQPLLTYQPSPFTIFYIGSTSNQNVDGLAFDNIQNGMLTDRQYFMKIQYLFN